MFPALTCATTCSPATRLRTQAPLRWDRGTPSRAVSPKSRVRAATPALGAPCLSMALRTYPECHVCVHPRYVQSSILAGDMWFYCRRLTPCAHKFACARRDSPMRTTVHYTVVCSLVPTCSNGAVASHALFALSRTGGWRCVCRCAIGQYSAAGGGACLPCSCANGTYCPAATPLTSGSYVCAPCPLGQYGVTIVPGNTTCAVCPIGTYGAVTGLLNATCSGQVWH